MSQTTKTQVTASVDLIKQYISNRKIAKLAALFTEEHQREQARRMFVYYNSKGWSSTTEVSIVYDDSDIIVTRSLSGYSKTSSKSYHAMWALGIAENQVWIHRLPWGHDVEDNKHAWTLQEVRDKMGFKEDLKRSSVLEKGKTMRIQGDITITMRATLDEYYEAIEKREIPNLEKSYDTNLYKTLSEKTTEQRQDLFKKYDDDIKTVQELSIKNKRNKKETEIVKALKKEYGLMPNHQLSLLIERIKVIREGYERKFIEGLMQEQDFNKEKQEYVKSKIEKMKEANRWARQINIRMGNHLIIIEKGQASDRIFPLSTTIYENTQCFIIHDEHSSKHLYLNAGVYSFNMLTRHVTDRRG